jgi:hypothetical protein
MKKCKESREAVAKTLELRSNGLKQKAIAEELNRLGFRTFTGGKFRGETISTILISQNMRTYKSKGHKVVHSATPVKAEGTGTGRWDVLKAIDSCGDLSPSSKKALLELAFKELNT